MKDEVKGSRIEKNGTEHMDMSIILGHRGASGYAPENTLEAFSNSASTGADRNAAASPESNRVAVCIVNQ